MILSNSLKSFFVFLLLLGTFACGFWRKPESVAPNPNDGKPEEIKSEIPFPTGEPEVFQTEIVNTIFVGDAPVEQKYFVARNGANRLVIFNFGAKNETAQLQTGDKSFLINRGKKVFAESSASRGAGATPNDLLTTGRLSEKISVTFENLGAENNLTKYSVRPADSPNSEIIVFVDENFKIPVREEFYSVDGEQKILTFTSELKNLKLQTDANVFEIPKDFRLLSPKEFQDISWREKFN